ncbi:MAG: class II glutamine amidotransferase [Myxococcales bacterium]|nr:class II glutamine amidotransferase [Myxococcales bacterium]
MCRLFGFKSSIASQVHRSLLRAENALAVQSEKHPDGWGVAYYVGGIPHMIRNADTAVDDRLFQRVSGIVASNTVLAHLRKATVGEINLLNCHPFQYGPWVFAHNGEIPRFDEVADELRARIAPRFRRFIMGTTDSEICFYLFLTCLHQRTEITQRSVRFEYAQAALQDTVAQIREVADAKLGEPSLLTFLATNGDMIIGCHGGKELVYSTHKKRCTERDTCPAFSVECENPTDGSINHVIISSEVISDEDIWQTLGPAKGIGVDHRMNVHTFDVAPASA